jgi:tetratricopeptide (TPR) repeat protein
VLVEDALRDFWDLCAIGQVTEALQKLEGELGLHPKGCDRGKLVAAKATALARSGLAQDAEDAIEELKPLILHCPSLVPYIEMVEAEIFAKDRDAKSSLHKFDLLFNKHRAFLNLDENARLRFDIQLIRADLLAVMKKYPRAKLIWKTLVLERPDNARAVLGLGLSLAGLQDFGEAKITLKHAVELGLNPGERARALWEIGYSHYYSGEFALAIMAFEECLKDLAFSNITRKALYNAIAASYQGLKMFDRADEYIALAKGAEKDPPSN